MTLQSRSWRFGDFLRPNARPVLLGSDEDADLVGMRLYGEGPFHREHKAAVSIVKKSHFRIRAGDVIYNKLFAWRGAFGIVPVDLEGMFVSDKFPTYELDHTRVWPGYLKWFFRYPGLWDQARSMSTGSAALSKLTLNPPKFMELQLPARPFETQKALAKGLDELEVKTSRLSNIRASQIANLDAAFSSILGVVFANLESHQCLADVLVGKPRNGWSVKCDNMEGGTAVLSLGAITGYHYRPEEVKFTSHPTDAGGHYWLEPQDLLIGRSNTQELVGHAAIYDGRPSPCIYPDLMMKLRPDPSCVEKRFLWYWLQAPVARAHIRAKARGTNPTMKKISQTDVMTIPFPIGLSLEDQRHYVERLDVLSLGTQHAALKARAAEHEEGAILRSAIRQVFD